MTEMYIMQRYLRPDLLRESGTINFDDWAAAFGETVTKLEPKPSGEGFRSKKRFSKFVNLPELVSFYKEFADIKTKDMVQLDVPDIKGGEPTVVVTEPDEYQKMGVEELAARSEEIHNGGVQPYEDNMLKITGEARLLGLDARTKYPEAPDTDSNKLSAVVRNVVDYYEKTKEQKGVQAIFCDIAVNDDDGRFSAYKAIKDKLIENGIPAEEICFAGDAKNENQRAKQHEELRNGDKRVVIGGTSKLGTGVNIQDRLCALHHLDIAWKPSDFEQRNGRGVRQGNMFPEIEIFHYVTQDTFDMYMMETIVRKSKFINQVMTNKCPTRSCEDVDDMTLTYSRIQAATTSNPDIIERFELNEELQTLRMLRGQHQKNQFKLQKEVERELPENIDKYERLLNRVSADIRQYNPVKTEQLIINIDGRQVDDRKDICTELKRAQMICSATHDSVLVGKCAGFNVYVEQTPTGLSFFDDDQEYMITVEGNLKYTTPLGQNNGLGNAVRLENIFNYDFLKKEKEISKRLESLKIDLEESKAALNKPFDREEEFQQKEARLAELNELLSQDDNAKMLANAGEEDDEQYALEDNDIEITADNNRAVIGKESFSKADSKDCEKVLDLTVGAGLRR